ncbi:sodium:solute symporter family protein [Clostridium lacusfryxellense]|uniref:sodium:solute symporter family protein n=1 Tax=Clostridium lacusfryxellense TaxID=205328 RepID=UPI001FEBB973|nr:sodium:solute symporter family protein [Clostridium lacusfryxellense]
MNIPLIIVILYIIILLGVSWYSTKLSKKGGAEGFLLAGRGMPASVVAVMVAGLAVGGASTVGVAESAYTKGISAGMYNAAWAAGAAIAGLVVAKKFRKMAITTVPELLGKYYGKTGKLIGVIGQLVIQMVITSLQYVAGASILNALLPNIFTFKLGMITTAVVFISITLIGGYWAAGLSNIINVIVIYVGLIMGAIVALNNIGGMSNIVSKLNPVTPWFNPVSGVGGAVVLAWFVVMITQSMSNQAVVQVSFAAKDGNVARKGYLLGALFILPVGFIAALYGIIAAAQFPGLENAAMALPKVVMSLNPIVAGITLAGLWAADVSTATGLLLGSATLVINDVLKVYVKSDFTQKHELMYSRFIVLIMSIITYILASTVVGILSTLLIGLSLTTAFTILVLATMFTPKLCKKSAAVWTLSVGILILVAWTFVPATHIVAHPIYLEWPICLVTFFLVFIFDKRPAITNELDKKYTLQN